MDSQTLLQDLQARIGALLRTSPAADLERNLKALLAQTFGRLDLVTREEFDTFAEVLAGLRARVETLEAALAQHRAAPAVGAANDTRPGRDGPTEPG